MSYVSGYTRDGQNTAAALCYCAVINVLLYQNSLLWGSTQCVSAPV